MLLSENNLDWGALPFQGEALLDVKGVKDFLDTPHMMQMETRQREADIEAMHEVASRIRKQVRSIIHSVRCWRKRHSDFENSTRLRYSAYEGALCYTDLRRHWMYYRHAMQELSEMRGRC